MSNFSTFSPFLTILILLLCCTTICKAQNNNSFCTPSSCGDITITYPFRLTTDPANCGYRNPIFALECRDNRTTLLRSKTRYYHVRTITYANFTLRLSDPGLYPNNYSSCPIYSSSDNDLYSSYLYYAGSYGTTVTFLNCLRPVNNPLYVKNLSCGNARANVFRNSSQVYSYATVERILVSDLEEMCTYDTMVGTSAPLRSEGDGNVSYSEIHDLIAYGFELSWFRVFCDKCDESDGDCVLEDDKVRCRYSCYEIVSLPQDSFGCTLVYYGLYSIYVAMAIGGIIALKLVLGVPFLIGLVVYKWKTRHSSMQKSEIIQELSQHQVNFMPINYTYGEIEKMTKNFKSELGVNVFKGNLRSGPFVAVKMLINSSSGDREFISHISKLSKVNHPNVAKLIGFCIEGTKKRALVHEFVHCGSLEKLISPREKTSPTLRCGDMCKIALGIAHGIECLHGVGIFYLGIELRNVLLDEESNPKISDCGVKNIYSSEGTKGNMGFIAPEIFYGEKNSCKADVYSFGMLVLEMASRLQYLIPCSEKSGRTYFPLWIYNQLRQGKDFEIMDGDEEDKLMVKKLILVALWCIQMKPVDRPSMSEVVAMLDGGIDELHLAPMPFHRAMGEDEVVENFFS